MPESNELQLPSILFNSNPLPVDVREYLDELSEKSGVPRNSLIAFIVRDFRDNSRTMTVIIG